MSEENQNVMPAGAMPPEPKPGPEVKPEVEPILGKFNSTEDLATAYTELEKKIGEQGNELGSMKQMNTMLMEQAQTREAQAQTPGIEAEKDTFDYDTQLSELREAVESGDIPFDQALVQASNLAAENATRNAVSKYEELTAAEKLQSAQQQFLDDNPDFVDLQRTGQLEPIKKALPGMHDDFSAYYALKAQQASQAAHEAATTEQIAQGDANTDKVLQKPGAKAKNIGKPAKRLSRSELREKTLADLEALG